MAWGRRKDNNQPYLKTGNKGIIGSGKNTKPVSDVHLRIPKELGKLMEIENQRNLVMDFGHGTTWYDLERDLSKMSAEDQEEALKLLRSNAEHTKKMLSSLYEIKEPDSFEKNAIESFERQLKITLDGIKELKKLTGI